MPSKNLNKIKKELEKAAKEKNRAKRAIFVTAVLTKALEAIDEYPILVGGAAVEFYTEAAYTTKDIDLVAPSSKKLEEIMKELGFKRFGKDYVHDSFKLYIEFPSSSLGEEEQYNYISVLGTKVKIISLEDLIIDRLASYTFWKSEIDGVNTLLLLEHGGFDQKLLRKRAAQEDLKEPLNAIFSLYQEIIRKKLSKKEASKKLRAYLQK